METYNTVDEVIDILANNRTKEFWAVVHDHNNLYTYNLAEDDIDTEYPSRKLLDLIRSGNVVVIEVAK